MAKRIPTRELTIRERQELDDYEPEKGLKRMLAAKAMEPMLRRAKDFEGLKKAVVAKLTEQRRFVLWWDQQEKSHLRRQKHASQIGDGHASQIGDGHALQRALKDFGLNRDMVSRWRTRYGDEGKFEAVCVVAVERCRRVCEVERGATEQIKASGTGDDEWYTPPKYLEAARDVLGAIDLDPASNKHAQRHVQAGAYFTQKDDGTKQEWFGRVWLNPPFSECAEFVKHLCEELAEGRVTEAILLTHNSTDTAWFHAAVEMCTAICFTKGRIKFWKHDDTELAVPVSGQAFCYFGARREAFVARFQSIGFLVAPL